MFQAMFRKAVPVVKLFKHLVHAICFGLDIGGEADGCRCFRRHTVVNITCLDAPDVSVFVRLYQ